MLLQTDFFAVNMAWKMKIKVSTLDIDNQKFHT